MCCYTYFGLVFGEVVLYVFFLSPVYVYYCFRLFLGRLKESKYEIQCSEMALEKNIYKCQIQCVKTNTNLVAHPNCKRASQLNVC